MDVLDAIRTASKLFHLVSNHTKGLPPMESAVTFSSLESTHGYKPPHLPCPYCHYAHSARYDPTSWMHLALLTPFRLK